MKCVNPRRLPNKAASGVNDAYIVASCGKCYACLANRRRSWLFRLQYENLSSVLSVFCTFTYDEDHCDEFLHKDDLQKFFKKLRHHDQFTYYAIGEYGTKTYRPHYHAVIFFKSINTNWDITDVHYFIQSLWQHGFVSVARVTYRRLNYVLHYHVRPKIVNNKRTFQLFSKGLGIDFIDDAMVKYLAETGATTVNDFNGNKYVIPRYYRKKLGFDAKPFEMDLHRDSSQLEKAFHRPAYCIPDHLVTQYYKDVIEQDKRKLNRYNNQDKYI